MTAHRLLYTGPGIEVECYACGLYAESTTAAIEYECRPGGWDHPPYLLADGSVETCAAHPYSDCMIDAPRFDAEPAVDDLQTRFDAAGVDKFPAWIERAGGWS